MFSMGSYLVKREKRFLCDYIVGYQYNNVDKF